MHAVRKLVPFALVALFLGSGVPLPVAAEALPDFPDIDQKAPPVAPKGAFENVLDVADLDGDGEKVLPVRADDVQACLGDFAEDGTLLRGAPPVEPSPPTTGITIHQLPPTPVDPLLGHAMEAVNQAPEQFQNTIYAPGLQQDLAEAQDDAKAKVPRPDAVCAGTSLPVEPDASGTEVNVDLSAAQPALDVVNPVFFDVGVDVSDPKVGDVVVLDVVIVAREAVADLVLEPTLPRGLRMLDDPVTLKVGALLPGDWWSGNLSVEVVEPILQQLLTVTLAGNTPDLPVKELRSFWVTVDEVRGGGIAPYLGGFAGETPLPLDPTTYQASTQRVAMDLSSADAARSNEPIVFVRGIDTGFETEPTPGGPSDWVGMKAAMDRWGWKGPKFAMGYYACDTGWQLHADAFPLGSADRHDHVVADNDAEEGAHNGGDNDCIPQGSPGLHDWDTSIEHLAYHVAWAMYDTFQNPSRVSSPQCIRIVAHSMGGVVVRYAMQQMEEGIEHEFSDEFPPGLCVTDIVTLGTPHNGAAGSPSCLGWADQCMQLYPESGFMATLRGNQHPDGDGGTDWTVLGSNGDLIVSSEEATTGIRADHVGVFQGEDVTGQISCRLDNGPEVEHYGNRGWRSLNDDTYLGFFDQEMVDRSASDSFSSHLCDGVPPGRFTDMSLAYDDWGCGQGVGSHSNGHGSWPLWLEKPIIGEPFTSTTDCWYRLHTTATQPKLYFELDSPGGAERWLYVYKDQPTGTAVCQGTTPTGTLRSCTYPAGTATAPAGYYYVKVQNRAGSTAPFKLRVSTTVEDIVSGTIVSPPKLVSGGSTFQLCWNLEGSGTETYTSIQYGPTNAYSGGQTTTYGGYKIPKQFCGAVTAHASGTVWARVHAVGPNDANYLGPGVQIPIEIPNDCGLGRDAGNALGLSNPAVTPSATQCNAALPIDDPADVYPFQVVGSGRSITATMLPSTGTDFDLRLYDAAGNLLLSSASAGTVRETLPTKAWAEGWYQLEVRKVTGNGKYTMTLNTPTAGGYNDCGLAGDAGNSFDAASSISPTGSPCTGTMPSDDGIDYYRFNVPTGAARSFTATLTPASGTDFDLTLVDPSRQTLTSSNVAGTYTDGVAWSSLTPGWNYLAVKKWGGHGSYTLTMSLLASGSAQNDCGLGTDAGNSISAASQTSATGTACTGFMPSGDAWDTYKFYVPSSGRSITAQMTPKSGSTVDYDLALFDANGNKLAGAAQAGSVGESLQRSATPPGWYALQVIKVQGHGLYTLTLNMPTMSGYNDCSTGVDAGNTPAYPTTLTRLGSACGGALQSDDPADYFRVDVAAGRSLTAFLAPGTSLDFDLSLLDGNGNLMASSASGTASYAEAVSWSNLAAGPYLVAVQRFSGSGSYALTVTVVASANAQNDCGTGNDASNSYGSAPTVASMSAYCNAFMAANDQVDHYRVNVAAGQSIRVSLYNLHYTNLDLKLLDPSGYQIGWSGAAGDLSEAVSASNLAAGTYGLAVQMNRGAAPYQIYVRVVASTSAQADCGLATDAGNSQGAASAVTPNGAACYGFLPAGDPSDHYKFQLTTAKAVQVTMTPYAKIDLNIVLYAADGSVAAQSAVAGRGGTEALARSNLPLGWYTLFVGSPQGYGDYQLVMTLTAVNDCNLGGDAPNGFPGATVAASGSCTGAIFADDRYDHYRFNVGSSGQKLTLTLTPANGLDADLHLYRSDGSYVIGSTQGGSATEQIWWESIPVGWYTVLVYGSAGTGSYTYGRQLVAPTAQNDCGSGKDAGNDWGSALMLSIPGGSGGSCVGHFPDADQYDYYRFYKPEGQNFYMVLTPPSGADFDVHMYDANGNNFYSSTNGGSAQENFYIWGPAGYYTMLVYRYSGNGDYTMQMRIGT